MDSAAYGSFRKEESSGSRLSPLPICSLASNKAQPSAFHPPQGKLMNVKDLDALIYLATHDLKEHEIRHLSFEDKGFTDKQVQTRLMQLASASVINIEFSNDKIGVVGISDEGREYFESLK